MKLTTKLILEINFGEIFCWQKPILCANCKITQSVCIFKVQLARPTDLLIVYSTTSRRPTHGPKGIYKHCFLVLGAATKLSCHNVMKVCMVNNLTIVNTLFFRLHRKITHSAITTIRQLRK